jgi:nitroreductase
MTDAGTEGWAISETGYPKDAPVDERLRFLLGYAVLAPSGHNAQPWLFRIRKGSVELHADRTRGLAVADPDDRELTLSCGCALYHLRIAIRRFGHRPETIAFPEPDDPDMLARVRPGVAVAPAEEDIALFRAIPHRRTNRKAFEPRPVEEATLAALSAAAAAEGAWLLVVRDPERRLALANLIAEGDRVQGADRGFRREMSAWAHPNRARSRDGLPGYVYGTGDLAHFVGPSVLRTFEARSGQAAQGADLAVGSPALAVLGTPDDSPESWLAAGQALGRLLLRARVDDVHASYLNQPIEIPDLRLRLREALGLSGTPQQVLRFGYGPEVPPTPRRAIEDVLLP